MMIIGEQVPDADDERDRPVDDAEQRQGGNPAVKGQPVRRRDPHRADAVGQRDVPGFLLDRLGYGALRRLGARSTAGRGLGGGAPGGRAARGLALGRRRAGRARRAGARAVPRCAAGPAVMDRSPAGQCVAHADGGHDRPFNDPDRAGYAEAGPEAQALVGDVAEDGQVHSGRGLLVRMLMTTVLGLAIGGLPPVRGRFRCRLLAHSVRIGPEPEARITLPG